MTIEEFDKIVGKVIKENIATYIPESELDYTPHEFSEEFKRKMDKLIESIGNSPESIKE